MAQTAPDHDGLVSVGRGAIASARPAAAAQSAPWGASTPAWMPWNGIASLVSAAAAGATVRAFGGFAGRALLGGTAGVVVGSLVNAKLQYKATGEVDVARLGVAVMRGVAVAGMSATPVAGILGSVVASAAAELLGGLADHPSPRTYASR